MIAVVETKRESLRWRGKFRAKTVSLQLRAMGQIAAADPVGNPKKFSINEDDPACPPGA